MQFERPSLFDNPVYERVASAYRAPEADVVSALLTQADPGAEAKKRIADRAYRLVEQVRKESADGGGIDAFMHEYELSSQEGVVLMCLAEALLRVPDNETIDKLIEDKIDGSDWEKHLGASESMFVNASTWGLMLSGRILRARDNPERSFGSVMHGLIRRSGEPVIRQAVRQAMRIMGRQFVMGRDIEEALKRARPLEKQGYRYSYDMLGEAARTDADAQRFFDDYKRAIEAIGRLAGGRGPVESPGISVKLSALHPRYELAHRDVAFNVLLPRLKALAKMAAERDINFTVDAEEAGRLDLSLELIEAVSGDPDLRGWNGFGLALQAYQKRAIHVIDFLADMAERHERRLMVRLVKGAYWDTEVKMAQEQGLADYPVFTRKANTDVCFLACARKMLADPKHFYAQFATHNAHSLAYVLEVAGDNRAFEFQRLHGMGESLYEQIVPKDAEGIACRIYAPVGSHEDLLAYLVRRLLENGANSSFVNRIVDEKTPIEAIITDPVDEVAAQQSHRHPKIPLPPDLFGEARRNAYGLDLSNVQDLDWLQQGMAAADTREWHAEPLIGGAAPKGTSRDAVHAPADRQRQVGTVTWATPEDVEAALACASKAFDSWSATPASERAACLERYADLLEADMPALIALCCREGGKYIPDGVAEVREAVDFCRYYAAQARREFDAPETLPGPTGERNTLSLQGRGVFVCISPWNFPLAIFSGQIAAALVAGNAVIAKPAEQTSIIGSYATQLMHRAGIPKEVLHLLPGDGPTVGGPLVSDARIAGVAFTGSESVAKQINRTLAERKGAILPLIAETGGMNSMIVDSSALPEQVVADVIKSSFQSAGQRCSALRVLYLQEDIADTVIEMLAGAMAELRIDDPWHLGADVTPVIDEDARAMLQAHVDDLSTRAKLIYRCPLPDRLANGTFFPPHVFELESTDQLTEEKFGPILHIVRFKAQELDAVVDRINATGYGLTFGIHTRIDRTAERVVRRIRAGNAYVNRNMIGAVVGVHPFGGEGLSGTGPKAGGPRYLYRFATERARSVDTTAAGGNASLMSLEEEAAGEEPLLLPEPQRYA